MSRQIHTGWVLVAALAFAIAACQGSGGRRGGSADKARVEPTPSATATPEKPGETVPPPPQPSVLTVESTPSGARVEIGLRNVNGVITPGTGRVIGLTPVTVELRSSDVSVGGTPRCNGVPILVTKARHFDHFAGVSVGPGCRLKPGSEERISVRLRSLQ